MEGGKKHGFSAVLAQNEAQEADLRAQKAYAGAAGEQVGLFESADTADLGVVLPTPSATLAQNPAAQGRGKGRPKGSANKSTAEWSEYLIGRYGSPVEHLARLATCDKVTLLREMQAICAEFDLEMPQKVTEIYELQARAAAAAAPYICPKMPVALNVDTTRRAILQIGVAQPLQRTASSAVAFDFAEFQKREVNQQLAECEDVEE